MRRLCGFRFRNNSNRITLVLQANTASWYRWQNNQLTETYVETVNFQSLKSVQPRVKSRSATTRQFGAAGEASAFPLSRKISGGLVAPLARASRCPWIDQLAPDDELLVELILDTSLDELDRVEFTHRPARWSRGFKRRLLRRHLRRIHPRSTTFPTNENLVPDCVSILHHVVSDEWQRWLELLEHQSVTFTHVATTTELLCHWSESAESPVLIVMPVGTDVRHLLVHQGHAIFMRMVKQPPDSPSQTDRIEQTLNYLDELLLMDDKALPVIELVIPGESHSDKSTPTVVTKAVAANNSNILNGADVHPAGLDTNETAGKTASRSKPSEKSEPVRNACIDTATVYASLSVSRPVSIRSLLHGMSNRGLDNLAVDTQRRALTLRLFSRFRGSAIGRPGCLRPVTMNSRITGTLLKESVSRIKRNAMISRMQSATLLTAVIAVLAATLASVHGFRSAMDRARIVKDTAGIHQQASVLFEASARLDEKPASTVRSLMLIDRFESTPHLQPAQLMVMIADAITGFPSVELTGLAWSVLDPEQEPLDRVFTTASTAELRRALYPEVPDSLSIQVELSGVVVNNDGLRQQQAEFDAMVRYLKAMPAIESVMVLESPVSSARSGISRMAEKQLQSPHSTGLPIIADDAEASSVDSTSPVTDTLLTGPEYRLSLVVSAS